MGGDKGAILTFAKVRISSTMTIDALQLDLLGTLRLSEGMSLAIGPFLGRRTAYGSNITETIVEPAEGTFGETSGIYPNVNHGRTQVYARNEGLDTGWRAGMLLLLRTPIELGGGFRAVPELRLRADFIRPFETDYWETLSAGVGLGFTYAISPLPSPFSPPPLLAQIDIYALSSDGRRMDEGIVSDGLSRRVRHLKLAPVILFDAWSTDLPSRYISGSSTMRGRFRVDSVARLNGGTIERSALDLLGAGLASRPRKLRLVASVVDGEPERVALARAESVRRYLGNTWGIDTTDIRVITERGRARGVSADGIIEIDGDWNERRTESSPVRVEPVIVGDAGVKSWRIRLEHDGREIASRRSDEGGKELSFRMLLSDLARESSRGPLVAELTVEDSSGGVSIARDSLRFRVEEPSGVTEYLLLGGLPSEELMRSVAASVKMGSCVTITPLSDRADIREAASALISRLDGGGVVARMASPVDAGEHVEGMRVEIEEGAVAEP